MVMGLVWGSGIVIITFSIYTVVKIRQLYKARRGGRRLPGREGKVRRQSMDARVGAVAMVLLMAAAAPTSEAAGRPESDVHVDHQRRHSNAANYTGGLEGMMTREADGSPGFTFSFSLFAERMLAGIKRRVRAERNAGRGGGYYLEVVAVGIRAKVVAPVLWVVVVICLVMSVMLGMEVLLLSAVSLFVKLFRRQPMEKRYKWEPIVFANDDYLEAGAVSSPVSLAFPLVLVQIPMYNEKEVYKLSIAAACALTWPPDRIIIQVLDDSTDPVVKELVELECKGWASKGIDINYEVRDNRRGYKAGALKEGMKYGYVQECEFVAIFDSDFQPQSDFLMQTIPFLMSNLGVALVQARWEFVNYKECMLTRMQRMTLDYHFKVEQEAGSSGWGFFGFNGTAGVWRIAALNEAGGWNDRTTVEDMDLAVRATLRGWKFIYAGNIKVKSELPSNFKAYRCQQYRWTCGAANLFRKMAVEIIMTKNVSFLKKVYVIYNFFFVRKVVAHIITFTFYSVVIPLSIFVPEVQIPNWAITYVPTTITVLNAIRNPRFVHLLVFWIVFENVMSLHRLKATISGLFEAGKINEWIVTEKLGETLLANPETRVQEKARVRFTERIYLSEIGFGIFLVTCATYNLLYNRNCYYVYIYLQAVAFFIIGFGYIGTFNSNT